MKQPARFLLSILLIGLLFSCEKDQGLLPSISFKTSVNYIYKDTTMPAKSAFTIGINAAKSEDKDVLQRFNISKSVNDANAQTVFSKDLSGAEGDNFSYDYAAVVDSVSGQKSKYTFTVTNRDGLVNQVNLIITTQ